MLVRTQSQIGAAQALVELDGLARRIVLCPPDLADEHLAGVIETAGVEAIVTDAPDAALEALGLPRPVSSPRPTGDRPGTGRRPCHRVAAVHLRHDRRAQDGGPHPGRPDRRHPTATAPRRAQHLGHLLRHPPLRRPADPAARADRRLVDDPLRRPRARRQAPGPARPARRHPPLRHALALAARADEPRASRHRAGLCAAFRRDRGPGGAGRAAVRLPRRRRRPRLRLDRGRRRLRGRRRPGRLPGRYRRARRRPGRDQDRGRLAAPPIAPRRARLCWRAIRPGRCRRLRRYRRHGRASRWSLPLRRPAQRR